MPKANNDDVATKTDIAKIEKSINKFATTTELKKTERILRTEILKVEEKVERVEEKVERVEEKVDRMELKLDKIAIQLDGFVGTVEDLMSENEIGSNQIQELKEKIKKHGIRITKLESTN